MGPLQALNQSGQSVWLDFIRRDLLTSGELKRLIDVGEVRGVTSNPSIFQKAITGSTEYDAALGALIAANPRIGAAALYEALACADIQLAADQLRPLYDASRGSDGFISLEVSPQLAADTAGTVVEARRLWQAVNRPNLMVKVPATPQGIAAMETLIVEGINVNVTLIFGLQHYAAVAGAYLSGLQRRAAAGQPVDRVASVASFFVSRVDTAVDKALGVIGGADAQALRGKAAVANAKLAYSRFEAIFQGPEFAALKVRGARVQRLLWASTGTKDPAYSDVKYVAELIGLDTVNTMPPETMAAFRDHGQTVPSLADGLTEARAVLADLEQMGIGMRSLTEQLQVEAVQLFAMAFGKLMAGLDGKLRSLLVSAANRQTLHLGDATSVVEARLAQWQSSDFVNRLWNRDHTLWSATLVPELTDRLGWLTTVEAMQELAPELEAFAAEIRAAGMRHVVLLGMGGSSLAPEVFQATFGNPAGHPRLLVLDSTHPDAVRAVEAQVDLQSSLFLVSSKSGTTPETRSLLAYFWDRVNQVTAAPGQHFAAITDPGTPLAQLARERRFRRTWSAPPDVGGRYAALTVFGLVPATLIGVDLPRLLTATARFIAGSARETALPGNAAVALGAALGELALAGKDKATFLVSPGIAPFGAWVEQLIAESTGKDNKGILPVTDEPLLPVAAYGPDRTWVYLRLAGDANGRLDAFVAQLEASGKHPVVRIDLADKYDLGQEFFRWEMATAAAAAVLDLHPFNQPDVQLAKDAARTLLTDFQSTGQLPVAASASPDDVGTIHLFLGQRQPGNYIALHAYLQPTAETTAALVQLQRTLGATTHAATTLGYGPRFLHSTGQFHKGGTNSGLFVQLIDTPAAAVPVPGQTYSFNVLIQAQALGDYLALTDRGRRVVRVHLGTDVAGGIKQLQDVVNRMRFD